MKKKITNLIKLVCSKNLFLKKLVFFFIKRKVAYDYYKKPLSLINHYAWLDNERSNFYYDLTDLNKEHLAQTISLITGTEYAKILNYFSELINNKDLYNYLNDSLKNFPNSIKNFANYGSEISFAYGRRLGWYAIARIIKPKVIIETGVDLGIGSCVLSSALLMNKSEGFEGQYIGTEINIQAGKLYQSPYNSVGRIIYGDSIETLNQIESKIDLFINDSDHSSEYEYKEYLSIKEKLSENSFILGDNSHVTDCLPKFSRISNRNFIFFQEKPKKHWYPGAGIGISFKNSLNNQ